jgi:hypothetical protein
MDLGAPASVNLGAATPNIASTGNLGLVRDLRFDFQDDITGILVDGSAVDANGVNVPLSLQGGLIVFGMNPGAVQRGFIYDYDGDGELSDGDTLVDLTDALMPVGAGVNFAGSAITAGRIISATSDTIELVTDEFDLVRFNLSEGDLVA